MKLAAIVIASLFLGGATQAAPQLAGCNLFPADNPWNQRVDGLPLAANSAAIVQSIGAGSS